jgi:alpha-tubulin suppressor-like RCC1 family protein
MVVSLGLVFAGLIGVPGPAFAARTPSAPVFSPSTASPKVSLTATGQMPVKTRRPVVLQVKSDSAWAVAASGTTTSKGRYRFQVKAPATVGLYRYRVVASKYGKRHGMVSKSRKLRVAQPYSRNLPTPGAPRYSTLAAGGAHSCAVRNGGMWCWGANSDGQLGNGTNSDSAVPVRVGTDSDWVSVSAGWAHTCGIRADGSAWCWGANDFNQLGAGSIAGSVNVPQKVLASNPWASVVAGGMRTCGIQTDGSAWCWGYQYSDNPHAGLPARPSSHVVAVPSLVTAADMKWTSIATNGDDICGSMADGTARCWTWAPDSTVRRIGAGSEWTGVVAGDNYVCGSQLDSSLWCWISTAATLSPDGATQAELPVRVVPEWTWASATVGDAAACGIKSDGTAWCWGGNVSGQLGNGTTTDSAAPTQVAGAGWTELAAGYTHGCGKRADGSVWCWGGDRNGQLGDGGSKANPVTAPVRVTGLP